MSQASGTFCSPPIQCSHDIRLSPHFLASSTRCLCHLSHSSSLFSSHLSATELHTTQHPVFTHFQAVSCRLIHAFTSSYDTEFNLHVVVKTYVFISRFESLRTPRQPLRSKTRTSPVQLGAAPLPQCPRHLAPSSLFSVTSGSWCVRHDGL